MIIGNSRCFLAGMVTNSTIKARDQVRDDYNLARPPKSPLSELKLGHVE